MLVLRRPVEPASESGHRHAAEYNPLAACFALCLRTDRTARAEPVGLAIHF